MEHTGFVLLNTRWLRTAQIFIVSLILPLSRRRAPVHSTFLRVHGLSFSLSLSLSPPIFLFPYLSRELQSEGSEKVAGQILNITRRG